MASNYTINMQPGVIYNDIHDNEVVNLTVADGKVTIGKGQEQMIKSSDEPTAEAAPLMPEEEALGIDESEHKEALDIIEALLRRLDGYPHINSDYDALDICSMVTYVLTCDFAQASRRNAQEELWNRLLHMRSGYREGIVRLKPLLELLGYLMAQKVLAGGAKALVKHLFPEWSPGEQEVLRSYVQKGTTLKAEKGHHIVLTMLQEAL